MDKIKHPIDKANKTHIFLLHIYNKVENINSAKIKAATNHDAFPNKMLLKILIGSIVFP